MAARVSVVLPVYNAGPFLRPAALSVLEERAPGVETVVVDDGSTDESLASIEDLPVRIVRQKNRGEAAARNAGVRASSGAFVTFLDGDDLLVPGGLTARLSYLEKNPSCGAVGGLPGALIGEDGKTLGEVRARMAKKLGAPFELTLEFYRRGGFFPVSCSLYLYRRETLAAAGPYDETLAAAPDCDLHYRVLARAAIPILDVATFDRRLHAANLSLAGSEGAGPAFRPDILKAIETVNRRHGMAPSEILPWEREYL